MAVADWSTTAADNTTVGPVNIGEGCPAANMNNMGREIMAQVKQFSDELPSSYQVKDATLTALAALTTAADNIPYATGADTFAMTALTSFARTLLDDADANAARITLGAIGISRASLGSVGYIEFSFGSSTFMIAWGTFVASGNGTTVHNYAAPFKSFSIPVVSGVGDFSANAQDNYVATRSSSASSVTVWNASDPTTTFYIAVGV